MAEPSDVRKVYDFPQAVPFLVEGYARFSARLGTGAQPRNLINRMPEGQRPSAHQAAQPLAAIGLMKEPIINYLAY
ncbi:MAG TPA: hypothetical protein VHE60_04310 [Pyrinomonadaceae bacterium]|nr:hypothetical protein [Pyrinomonadaceae bacterium]